MTDYMQQHREKELARKLFVEHNRANGALYPDGFGFLSPAMQAPWLDKAREKLAAEQPPESKFAADLRARLALIDEMIRSAKSTERRQLQRERSDLEDKLRRAEA